MPYPTADAYVYYAVYDHLLLIEFANCALLLGRFEEAFKACRELLSNPNLPAEFRASVQSNYELAHGKLESAQSTPVPPQDRGRRLRAPTGSGPPAESAADADPLIVVLGPRCGGTSAVAGVLHHLGVFMGGEFTWTYREPHETWEDRRLSLLCGHAFRGPGDRLQMNPGFFEAKLRGWADEHRRAARAAGRRPGAKDPLLCLAVDFLRAAWGPVVPVVVDRPVHSVVASLNRLGWLRDEQERAESTARLIGERDRALGDTAVVRVDFEALRTTPTAVIRRLASELNLEVTDAQLRAAAESIAQSTDARRGAGNADRYGIDALRAKVERNPDDAGALDTLAAASFDSGDFAQARSWCTRRAEMGGADEDVFVAMFRIAESMARLGVPWLEVQEAYLQAWEFRPIRAEPLYAIAQHYRTEKRYQLGYLFAQQASQIPLPENDLVVGPLDSYPIYGWRATEEQLLCALRIGNHTEAFTLCRRLLARPDIPDDARSRIANNRDVAVPAMLEAAAAYPDPVVAGLTAGSRDTEVIVSLIAGRDRHSIEQTLNSFLQCCTDVARVGRFLVVDAGLSASERTILQRRYGFAEFTDPDPEPGALRTVFAEIDSRLWLHLGAGWRFFAPENLITRLRAVLDAEPQAWQVGINYTDANTLTGSSAPEHAVRRAGETGRYVMTHIAARGPAMFDTVRLDPLGDPTRTGPDPIGELALRAAAAGLSTASLDEVLCISAP